MLASSPRSLLSYSLHNIFDLQVLIFGLPFFGLSLENSSGECFDFGLPVKWMLNESSTF